MKNVNSILISVVVVAVLFAILWWSGRLVRLKSYWDETMAEMHRSTWPTWNELKGATLVVFISIMILGGFTMLVDAVLFWCVRYLA